MHSLSKASSILLSVLSECKVVVMRRTVMVSAAWVALSTLIIQCLYFSSYFQAHFMFLICHQFWLTFHPILFEFNEATRCNKQKIAAHMTADRLSSLRFHFHSTIGSQMSSSLFVLLDSNIKQTKLP